jgi:hypothetical protein
LIDEVPDCDTLWQPVTLTSFEDVVNSFLTRPGWVFMRSRRRTCLRFLKRIERSRKEFIDIAKVAALEFFAYTSFELQLMNFDGHRYSFLSLSVQDTPQQRGMRQKDR